MSGNKNSECEPVVEYESGGFHPRGFLTGLLIGGLTGAGAMLLMAPHSGKRTRANIQYKSMELRNQANSTVEDAVTQAKAKANQIKTSVLKGTDQMQSKGHDAVDDGMQYVTDAVEAGNSAIQGH